MKKSTAIFSLLILLGIVLAGYRLFFHHVAHLTLQNRSGGAIAELVVTIPGQPPAAVGALAAGAERTVTFHEYGEGSWEVSGRWADGTVFRERYGYVTTAVSLDDELVFLPEKKTTHHNAPSFW